MHIADEMGVRCGQSDGRGGFFFCLALQGYAKYVWGFGLLKAGRAVASEDVR